MLTVAGGEELSRWDDAEWGSFSQSITVIRWQRVYATAIFVALALIPAVHLLRQKIRERRKRKAA